MIAVQVKDYNNFSQKYYDNIVCSIILSKLYCLCGEGHFIWYGSYFRYVITPAGKIRMRIARVRCTKCGTTHAILLSSMIPYSQVTVHDQAEIIRLETNQKGSSKTIMDSNPELSPSHISRILLLYFTVWREMLKLIDTASISSLWKLSQACFNKFSLQFMQSRTDHKILYFLELPT